MTTRLTIEQSIEIANGKWAEIPLTGKITQPFGDTLPDGVKVKFYASSTVEGTYLSLQIGDNDVGHFDLLPDELPDLDLNVRELERVRTMTKCGVRLTDLFNFYIAEAIAPTMRANVGVEDDENGVRFLNIYVWYGNRHEVYHFPNDACKELFGIENVGWKVALVVRPPTHVEE